MCDDTNLNTQKIEIVCPNNALLLNHGTYSLTFLTYKTSNVLLGRGPVGSTMHPPGQIFMGAKLFPRVYRMRRILFP